MQIRCRTGRRVDELSLFSHEAEVLYGPACSFRVVQSSTDSGGVLNVTLEEVQVRYGRILRCPPAAREAGVGQPCPRCDPIARLWLLSQCETHTSLKVAIWVDDNIPSVEAIMQQAAAGGVSVVNFTSTQQVPVPAWSHRCAPCVRAPR